ncbi:hypothetical protein FSP39_001989 [Pinctada imbricata]|uniref:acetate--CoA ligase n=1 Tax=Pinctada imbricata TaxID=66713 RepID=A0AA88XY08_PINIB|nr:hypothetical protein FSP39_001989 [Pinctada imbricata]
MSGSQVFSPPKGVQKEAHVQSLEQYKEMHKLSVENPEEFWSDVAKQFHWESPVTGKFLDYNFDVNKGPIYIKWMEGAKTNISFNCLDRHINNKLGDKVAFYWEGNNPDDEGKITFKELKDKVCQCANVLKSLGLKKGDRVAIYMPMIVELTVAMLACARIGIIHSIVFAGFSAESLADRILDAKCSAIFTADGVYRGTKLLNLKAIVDEAVKICTNRNHNITKCIVVRHLSPSDEDLLQNNHQGNGDTEAARPCRKIKINWTTERDIWWHEIMDGVSTECDPVWMDAEDPLFMLYTSGSTGKPKGVLHTVAGYMLYSATTFKYSFDYQGDDIFWCTADVGWITGHTYVCYGPLNNGATGIIFEGVPFYPDAGRFWAIVEKYKVTKFYTAPTAIRALMKFSEEYVTKYDTSSLKVLGTVGEPINPEAWLWYYNVVGKKQAAVVDTFWQTETVSINYDVNQVQYEFPEGVRYDTSSLKVLGTVGEPINSEAWLWYYNVVGKKQAAVVDIFWQTETVSINYNVNQVRYQLPEGVRYDTSSLKVLGTVGEPINPEAWLWYYNVVGKKQAAVVDTFWQTETGGHVITPLPGATPTKPGSATFPFFGVIPAIMSETGEEITEPGKEGYLVFRQPWPGIMRTVYGDHQRFETTYFKKFPGYYCTGDGAKKDADGYLWVTGRIDDMVNVSGHLLSTAEIESALVEHQAVAEAAVVSHPHNVKGECTYCFVTLKEGQEFTDDLVPDLKNKVRQKIGPFAQPDFIQNAPGLPKTRSGKIMRRILRKIAVGDRNVGDITTMADESVIDKLFQLRPKDA